jgi:hypothetical protein
VHGDELTDRRGQATHPDAEADHLADHTLRRGAAARRHVSGAAEGVDQRFAGPGGGA